MIRSQYELEHGNASRVIPRKYPLVQLLMRGLASLLGLNHATPCLTKDWSATPLQAISADIRLHGSAKVPTSTPAGLTQLWRQLMCDTFGLHCPLN